MSNQEIKEILMDEELNEHARQIGEMLNEGTINLKQSVMIAEIFVSHRALSSSLKLAVKALEHYAEWIDWEDDSMGDKARVALDQIRGEKTS